MRLASHWLAVLYGPWTNRTIVQDAKNRARDAGSDADEESRPPSQKSCFPFELSPTNEP